MRAQARKWDGMVSARVPSRSKMKARSGLGISVTLEKSRPTCQAPRADARPAVRCPAVDDRAAPAASCRLVGARGELSDLPKRVSTRDRDLPARRAGFEGAAAGAGDGDGDR